MREGRSPVADPPVPRARLAGCTGHSVPLGVGDAIATVRVGLCRGTNNAAIGRREPPPPSRWCRIDLPYIAVALFTLCHASNPPADCPISKEVSRFGFQRYQTVATRSLQMLRRR